MCRAALQQAPEDVQLRYALGFVLHAQAALGVRRAGVPQRASRQMPGATNLRGTDLPT